MDNFESVQSILLGMKEELNKRPWSISTTIRNPNRIFGLLKILKGFEGETFDQDIQIKYQIKIIQEKLYKPEHLDDDLSKHYSKVKNMSNRVAINIFEHMKHRSKELQKDPGLRGRTSVAPLTKMGLAITKKTNGRIIITDLGNDFLQGRKDVGEVMLDFLYKWTLPNPENKKFSEKKGFNIRPFVATLMVVDGVNKKWKKMGNKPVGISKEEFSFFIPTTIHYGGIDDTIQEIIKLRLNTAGKNKVDQKKIRKEYYLERIKNFYSEKSEEKIDTRFRNLKDYGDNIVRYFILTRFFYVRGGGYYIDVERQRSIEINSIFGFSNAEGLMFESKDEYIKYIMDEAIFPWENIEELKKIAKKLCETVNRLNGELLNPFSIEKQKIKNIEKSNNKLKECIRSLRKLKKKIQVRRDWEILSCPDEFKEIIVRLIDIFNSENRAIDLEYLVTRCLHAIDDAEKIEPNYPVGDDNKPTFTAPANVPDIECIYISFNLVCEVTMLRTRDQWINEGQPVMRHLRDFEDRTDGDAYCLFVAPKIHRDTFNTFIISNKHGYEGKKQKIVPISLNQFIEISNMALSRQMRNKPIKHEEFRAIIQELCVGTTKVRDMMEWTKMSNKIIERWCNVEERA